MVSMSLFRLVVKLAPLNSVNRAIAMELSSLFPYRLLKALVIHQSTMNKECLKQCANPGTDGSS